MQWSDLAMIIGSNAVVIWLTHANNLVKINRELAEIKTEVKLILKKLGMN